MRKSSLFSAVCVLVVMACTGLIMHRPAESASLNLILNTPDITSGSERFRLVYVFRPEDCAGNLRLLAAVQRPALRSRLTVAGLLYGSDQDVPRARRLLARAGVETPIRPLTTRQSAALAPLGHRAMPFWLLFDPEGQLVLSLSTPATVQEHLRTIDLLTKVTDAR
jgi:hypothetical protein